MAFKQFVLGLSVIGLASAASALPTPMHEPVAPAAPAEARYCLRMEPITGSRIETVRCETRFEWAQLEVNLDEEWAENGVGVVA